MALMLTFGIFAVYLFPNQQQTGIIWHMQAVVLIGKSQYLVSEGDILEVDLGQDVIKGLDDCRW